MQITYNNITIPFWDFNLPKQVTVSLSGGLDSAAVTYLTCKHFPQLEIIPFTCRDENAPRDAEAARRIVIWLQNEFPHMSISDLRIFNFNDRDESYITWAECDKAIQEVNRFALLNRVQVSKILQLRRASQTMMSTYQESYCMSGMTSNPPVEDMKTFDFYHLAERRRDVVQNTSHPTFNERKYLPFLYVDKKFVADIYQQNNLMETLYPLTRSCTGTARTTDNFTKECHLCFWCHEKKWAFNLSWD